MSGHLALGMTQFCQKIQERACNTISCDRLGESCDATGCNNRACKIHEHYCSGCELRYCEDCYEAHLEACLGPVADSFDERIEQALVGESAPFTQVFPMPTELGKDMSLTRCIPNRAKGEENQQRDTDAKIPGELRVLLADEKMGGAR